MRPLGLSRMLFSLGAGGAFGSLTLAVEKLSAISENLIVGTTQRILFALLYPGIFGSMALSGNVHAWHLWIAAGINGFIYFGLAWLAVRLISGFISG